MGGESLNSKESKEGVGIMKQKEKVQIKTVEMNLNMTA